MSLDKFSLDIKRLKFALSQRIDNWADVKQRVGQRTSFIKYVKLNTVVGCDEVGNLLVFRATNLEQIRSIPYGHTLRDSVGTENFVFCAFENKLVVFRRDDWSIETKWDTIEEINCLAVNEFNEVRVCGMNGFNWYVKNLDKDLDFSKGGA